MSLRDPDSKMSKSSEDDFSRINLNDDPDLIAQKIKRAVTDSQVGITYDIENRRAVANLVDIYSYMTNRSVEDVCQEHASSNMAKFKSALTEVVVAKLRPIQMNLEKYSRDEAYIDSVLESGTRRANEIAGRSFAEIRKIVGLD